MTKINYIREPSERKESDWVLVGKAWPHKVKDGAYSGRFGIKAKDADGNLGDLFTEITVSAGDPIMIRPNLNQRPGKQDPVFLMYMLKKA